MTREALACAWREAHLPYQRAHVTPYLYENPSRFDIIAVKGNVDYSDHRWTLDTPEDIAFIRALYERLGNNDDFTWREALVVLQREPELVELNRCVMQKALQEG